jgi:nitrate/TMAO reductase-like tetraheme cytochrome c subunit
VSIIDRFQSNLTQHTARTLILSAVLVVVFLFAFFLGSLELVHYTESTAFCTSCHAVMNPEATTHELSPHANTDCGTCHVGPGAWPTVKAKLENLRYLWVYPLGLYDRPLSSPLSQMRPAEATCEQCHWPAQFYPLRLITLYDYAQDENNSLTRTVLALRTGGGHEDPQDRKLGIHWHIQNPVTYIASDESRQVIPWVQVERDGQTKTYIAADAQLSQAQIDQAQKRVMDCMDCHNRATHIVRRPDDALDEAMSNGEVPADLPFFKQQAMQILDKEFGSYQEANAAAAQISDFYRQQYPEVYASRRQEIDGAIQQVQLIYEQTHFPYMKVYWSTYPDNVGHADFPGCFRCHDGKHITADNEVIRLECNLCHAIPQVAKPGQPLPAVDLTIPQPPPSHESTLWLAEHRFKFDASCANCHDVSNPGGADNTSFCSNSACHGRAWPFVGLNAPRIRGLVEPPHVPSQGGPPPIPHPIGPDTDCRVCHGIGQVLPFPENHVSYSQDICTSCHQPSLPVATPTSQPLPTATPSPAAETATARPATSMPEVTPTGTPGISPAPTAPSSGAAPAIPHSLEGRDNCLQCHDPNGNIVPAPSDHEGRPVGSCLNCHQSALPVATSTPQALPTVTPSPAAETATAHPATSPPEVTPTGTPTASPSATAPTVGAAPAIPHSLEGRDNCLQCHDPSGNIVPAPPDHEGRPVGSCLNCHQPAE